MNEKPRVSSLGGKETSLLQEQSTLDLFSQAVLDSYVRELPNIGTDQRRRLTAFGAVISKKLKKSSSPSPSDLVGLRLRYPTGRKSAACGFFAKFLVASGLWTDKDLAEFEQLTGRRSVKITAFSLPFLDKEIRGQALQRIRQVLGSQENRKKR